MGDISTTYRGHTITVWPSATEGHIVTIHHADGECIFTGYAGAISSAITLGEWHVDYVLEAETCAWLGIEPGVTSVTEVRVMA